MSEVGNVIVKWGGKEYNITGLQSTSTVLEVKNLIFAETCVLPERQKLLGLKCSGERLFAVSSPHFQKSQDLIIHFIHKYYRHYRRDVIASSIMYKVVARFMTALCGVSRPVM